MNCTICHRPAPSDEDLMTDDGCAPHYYHGGTEVDGPVCPECHAACD